MIKEATKIYFLGLLSDSRFHEFSEIQIMFSPAPFFIFIHSSCFHSTHVKYSYALCILTTRGHAPQFGALCILTTREHAPRFAALCILTTRGYALLFGALVEPASWGKEGSVHFHRLIQLCVYIFAFCCLGKTRILKAAVPYETIR